MVSGNYHIQDLEWQVEISPGHTITVNGTIEDVATQLHTRNPDWEADHPAVATTVKRATDFSGGSYFCGARWPYAHLAAYWEGLRACSRVSCSYGSAVYLCNDRTEDLRLDSFERIADGLSYIIGRCTTNAWGTGMVAGQLFHPDNIIVRQDSC
ncbi:hypothetical protein C8A00DRAFT_45489 [Chaetomidium leptoderma]|uniref:Uncharacterized protein n=1 Tax=Chaetomidium leptoderma TaxID=669021 RepID=A0AAN6VGT8_9PEZI|nr:hypothetical protein C8A00DRAFT_45489 [Chaetomidium leptoderma]